MSSPGDGLGISVAAAFWTNYRLEIESRGGAAKRLSQPSRHESPEQRAGFSEARGVFVTAVHDGAWLLTRPCCGRNWHQARTTGLPLSPPGTLHFIWSLLARPLFLLLHPNTLYVESFHALVVISGHVKCFWFFCSKVSFRHIALVDSKLFLCRHDFYLSLYPQRLAQC